MTDASIAIAASSRTWAMGLHRFVADHGGARVRVRVMHPEDALSEDYDVLVIDDITSFMSAHFVKQVQRNRHRVLGVFDEPAGEQRLRTLGVDDLIEARAAPEDFVDGILRLVEQRDVDQEFAGLLAGLHDESRDDAPASSQGTVIAVCGAGGGVGTTEVAVSLTADISARGTRALVVDLDEVAAAVAQRLDLPLHPNVRTAMDVLQHGNGSVLDTLIEHPLGFGVLAGIPDSRTWRELPWGDAVDLLVELSHASNYVLVNTSSIVEQQSPDLDNRNRFGMTRLILPLAHHVVLVVNQSPTAMTRTMEWLADTRSLIKDKPLHVFVNRFEDGSFARHEIETQLHGVVRPASITFGPYDRSVLHAAWEGVVSRRSQFAKAVAGLADSIAPMPVSQRWRLIGT